MMDEEVLEQYLNDVLKGMVARRQYDHAFNNPQKFAAIREVYGKAYRRE